MAMARSSSPRNAWIDCARIAFVRRSEIDQVIVVDHQRRQVVSLASALEQDDAWLARSRRLPLPRARRKNLKRVGAEFGGLQRGAFERPGNGGVNPYAHHLQFTILHNRGMRSRLLILMLLAVFAFGATTRLYLKDGTFQLVREYQVLEDRVKYLSADRGEWEEIPLELIDLNRTKKEVADREESLRQVAKEDAEEDAAVRAEREEIARIPQDPGAYYIHEAKMEPLKGAEVKFVTDKTRAVLKVLSPIPAVKGKSTVEVDGGASEFRITEDRPEFYFRLNAPENLAIIKLPPKKNVRVVENISKLDITGEVTEDRQVVETFKKAIGDQLYKIWPEKPLPPGEYALIEFTDGAETPQVWDFGVGPLK